MNLQTIEWHKFPDGEDFGHSIEARPAVDSEAPPQAPPEGEPEVPQAQLEMPGLKIQKKWLEAMRSGKKTVELRTYNIDKHLFAGQEPI